MKAKIAQINVELQFVGAKAVQEKPSLGGRPCLYGFIPQYVFDATNQILGYDGWSHTIDEHWSTEKQALVKVTVTIGETSHTQFGESMIVRGDLGSAMKGAVTDAIQKSLALFGVGSSAYRGELKAVYKKGVSDQGTKVGDLTDHFTSLHKTAQSLAGDIEKGRDFWRQNSSKINACTDRERKELAEILQGVRE